MTSRPFLRTLLALLGIFVWQTISADGGNQSPPRSFGPIELGMTAQAFERITGVRPSPCVHCAEGEEEADVYIDKALASHMRQTPAELRGANLRYQPNSLTPEDATCFFYKGKLHTIVLNGVKDKSASVISRYERELGAPAARDTWDTGLSQVRWQDGRTILAVTYTTKSATVDHLQIDYIERKIQASVPRRHSPP